MTMYESNDIHRFTQCDECGSTNIKIDHIVERKKSKKTISTPLEKG